MIFRRFEQNHDPQKITKSEEKQNHGFSRTRVTRTEQYQDSRTLRRTGRRRRGSPGSGPCRTLAAGTRSRSSFLERQPTTIRPPLRMRPPRHVPQIKHMPRLKKRLGRSPPGSWWEKR
eukprot:1344329-Rhodomonas_salina.1